MFTHVLYVAVLSVVSTLAVFFLHFCSGPASILTEKHTQALHREGKWKVRQKRGPEKQTTCNLFGMLRNCVSR